MPSDQAPIRIAVLGAGIFVTNDYVPLFSRHKEEVQVCAIWSRSANSVEVLLPSIRGFSSEVKGYHGKDGLQHLLQDKTIEAVVVVLPVHIMLEVAQQALEAGKHVMQEKPVANSVRTAAAAIAKHRAARQQPVWALAENYRCEQAFCKAVQLIPELGTVIKLDLVADMPMNPANKYFNSEWRRTCQSHRAGFGEVVEASATSMSVCKELPPPDTLLGSLKFTSGKPASVSISFAGSVLRFSLSVTGTKGSLEVLRGGWQEYRGGYTLSYQINGRQTQSEQVKFCGLDSELMAFVHQVKACTSGQAQSGSVHDAQRKTAPEEGAHDLAVIEALLQSSQENGKGVRVCQVSAAS